MRPIDHYLGWAMRRARAFPGARHIAGLLQTGYARHYLKRPDRWITIDDFDGGARMRLNRASPMGSAIYWSGYYSLNEIAVFRRLLEVDSVVIDGGAHAGEFTVVAAHRAPRGRVLSFEPVPAVVQLLRENVRLNGFMNVTVFPLALSDVRGEIELFGGHNDQAIGYDDDVVYTQFSGYGRTAPTGRAFCRTLDEIIEDAKLDRLDVVKLDIEGAEVKALRGARDSLRRYRPHLIVEVAEPLLRSAGSSADELFALLFELRYRTFLISDYRLREMVSERTLRRFGRLTEIDRATVPPFANILCRPA